MENTNAMGQRIRSIRKKLRLTQKEFAKALGVTYQTVSMYELGDIVPPLEAVKAIVKMGNKSTDWLIFGFEPVAEETRLSDTELKLIQNYRQASDEAKAVILKVAEYASCKS